MSRTVFNHGAYYVLWAFRDSNGYAKGILTDPENTAAGTATDAYLMRNVVSFTPPAVTYGEVTERGGQRIRGKFKTPVTEIGTAAIELSSDDPVLRTYANGSSIDSTMVTGWKQYAPNINLATFPAAFMIISTRTMIIDDVAQTQTYGWKHYVCPNAQLELQQSQVSQTDGENPNPITGTITLNKSYRALTGHLFSATAMNITEDNEYYYVIETNYPIALSTYIANGDNPETWTANYLPRTSHATTTDKKLTENGVNDTLTGFSVTTGVVTTATGVALAIYELLYEVPTDYPLSP